MYNKPNMGQDPVYISTSGRVKTTNPPKKVDVTVPVASYVGNQAANQSHPAVEIMGVDEYDDDEDLRLVMKNSFLEWTPATQLDLFRSVTAPAAARQPDADARYPAYEVETKPQPDIEPEVHLPEQYKAYVGPPVPSPWYGQETAWQTWDQPTWGRPMAVADYGAHQADRSGKKGKANQKGKKGRVEQVERAQPPRRVGSEPAKDQPPISVFVDLSTLVHAR